MAINLRRTGIFTLEEIGLERPPSQESDRRGRTTADVLYSTGSLQENRARTGFCVVSMLFYLIDENDQPVGRDFLESVHQRESGSLEIDKARLETLIRDCFVDSYAPDSEMKLIINFTLGYINGDTNFRTQLKALQGVKESRSSESAQATSQERSLLTKLLGRRRR